MVAVIVEHSVWRNGSDLEVPAILRDNFPADRRRAVAPTRIKAVLLVLERQTQVEARLVADCRRSDNEQSQTALPHLYYVWMAFSIRSLPYRWQKAAVHFVLWGPRPQDLLSATRIY